MMVSLLVMFKELIRKAPFMLFIFALLVTPTLAEEEEEEQSSYPTDVTAFATIRSCEDNRRVGRDC